MLRMILYLLTGPNLKQHILCLHVMLEEYEYFHAKL